MNNVARKIFEEIQEQTIETQYAKQTRLQGYVVVLCLLCGLIAALFVSKQITIMNLNKKIYNLQQENLVLKQEIEELKAEFQRSQSLYHIEEMARTRLGMIFPKQDQIIVKLVEPEVHFEGDIQRLTRNVMTQLVHFLHHISMRSLGQ